MSEKTYEQIMDDAAWEWYGMSAKDLQAEVLRLREIWIQEGLAKP